MYAYHNNLGWFAYSVPESQTVQRLCQKQNGHKMAASVSPQHSLAKKYFAQLSTSEIRA